jgi:drug/metabolite transporter (DMT)-like permease
MSSAAQHTDQAHHRIWVTDLLLLLMATIWGINFSVVKFGTEAIAPLAFNGIRVALAAVALLAVIVVQGRALPPRSQVWALLGLGVLGNGLYQLFFVEGIARTRAGNAALVMAAGPALIALFGRFYGVEKVHLRGYAGIALSVIGIGIVMSGTAAAHEGSASLLGDILILCGSATWAAYTVLLKPLTHSVDGVTVSALTMVGGAVPLLAVASPALVATPWRTVPLDVWLAIGYSGLFALVLAYLIWYRGIKFIGPTRTAMYGNLQPIIAVLVAWVALGEVPTLTQGGGALFVFAGLLLTRA